jgi:hypothetical protein
MDQQLVIKLSETTNAPIGLVESPPILYSNFKKLFAQHHFQDVAAASEVEPLGYGVFEYAWPPTDTHYTKSIDDIGLTKHPDGIWRPTFVERNATQEEIIERTAMMSLQKRAERNSLLDESDYTQLPDCGLSNEKVQEFAIYRQALRDITKQSGFPWDFNFPVKPTEGNAA